MSRLYRISASFLPSDADVIAFEGEEAVNQLYRLRILFSLPLAEGLALDLDGATGQTAQLLFHHEQEGATARTYSGVVAALELVEDLARHSIFRLHLVPKVWKLSLGEHSRVFIAKTLPEILKQTLDDGGLGPSDYDIRLTGKYAALPHVCQMRESRLHFMTRWLERVGAYYFFEQQDDQEKLILTDSESSHWKAREEPVRFVPQHGGDATAGEALRSFRSRHDVVPRKVHVADYYPLHPLLAIEGSADVVPDGLGGEIRLFKVNEETPDGAKQHAKTRALEQLERHSVCQAQGLVYGLMPGLTFDLSEHPRGDLNQGYLVTAIRHRGREPGAAAGEGYGNDREPYHCELEAVEASHHFHPASVTRWPRVSGTIRATIDGEAESEYAQIDEHGRYLVRLMLDESGLPDGGASTRLRMMQPHAGSPEGMHLPLRKGTEVQVGFLRGDPDQPVIVGVVPNATTPSPVTSDNRSQNVVQTGGLSRVEIEDKQGAEYIDISTPPEKTFAHFGAHAGLGSHNYVISTTGDYSMHTGTNRHITVGGKQTEKVKGNVNESYHADQTTHVEGSLTETIDGGATQTITAGSGQTIDGGATETITGGETRTIAGGQQETLDGGRTQTITGSSIETITGDITQTITGAATITTPANHTVLATGGFEMSTPATVTLIANGGFNLLAPGGQRRLDNDFNMFGGKYVILAPNQRVTVGHRIDLMVGYLELIGLKVDGFGLKQTIGTTLKQAAILYLGTDGAGANSHAFSQQGGAFQTWGG